MKRHPVRHERGCAPETEAWKIIFGAFAVSGSLVIGWTVFVLLTDTSSRTPRLADHAAQTTEAPGDPAKP